MRLREALEKIRVEASGREAMPRLSAGKEMHQNVMLALSGRLGGIERLARAALTQPEPTAQQAAGEAEAVAKRIAREIVPYGVDGRGSGEANRMRMAAYKAALAALATPQPTETQRMPCPDLTDLSHDEAWEWITANCTAIRRDNGDMDYSLGAMIAAYEAGKAAAGTETQRIVDGLLDELILLAHQYRNDLIYPLADDSRERRIAAIDAVLAKTGEK
jgi:hypothetical protein